MRNLAFVFVGVLIASWFWIAVLLASHKNTRDVGLGMFAITAGIAFVGMIVFTRSVLKP